MLPLAPDVGGVGRLVIGAKDWVEFPYEIPRNETGAQDLNFFSYFKPKFNRTRRPHHSVQLQEVGVDM